MEDSVVFGEYFYINGLRRWFMIDRKKISYIEHEEADTIMGIIPFGSVEDIQYDEKKLSIILKMETGKFYELTSVKQKNFELFLQSLLKVDQIPTAFMQKYKFENFEKQIEEQKEQINQLQKTVRGQKSLISQMQNIIHSRLGQQVLQELQESSLSGVYLDDLNKKVIDSETIKLMVDEEFKKSGMLGMLTRDTLLWKATFENCNPVIKGILLRILTTLVNGGLMFRVRDTKEWEFWWKRNWPVVSALSHGGRVIIQLPPSSDDSKYGKHGFWKWLLTGNPETKLSEVMSLKTSGTECRKEGKVVFKRLGSTHSISVFSEEEADISKKIGTNRKNGETYDFVLPMGRQKIVYEKKTIELINVFAGNQGGEKNYTVHKHWGMNIPLGGENQNRLDGQLIQADGRNGHLYMMYLAPKKGRFGALMIGLEGSEYGKKDAAGMKHSIRAKSNPYSPTFGYKWFSKKHNDLRPFKVPDKYNSMLVDLSICGWEFMMEKERFWKDDLIFGTTFEVDEIKRDIDGINNYVDMLRRKKSKRSLISSLSKGAKRFSRNLGKKDQRQ